MAAHHYCVHTIQHLESASTQFISTAPLQPDNNARQFAYAMLSHIPRGTCLQCARHTRVSLTINIAFCAFLSKMQASSEHRGVKIINKKEAKTTRRFLLCTKKTTHEVNTMNVTLQMSIHLAGGGRSVLDSPSTNPCTPYYETDAANKCLCYHMAEENQPQM